MSKETARRWKRTVVLEHIKSSVNFLLSALSEQDRSVVLHKLEEAQKELTQAENLAAPTKVAVPEGVEGLKAFKDALPSPIRQRLANIVAKLNRLVEDIKEVPITKNERIVKANEEAKNQGGVLGGPHKKKRGRGNA